MNLILEFIFVIIIIAITIWGDYFMKLAGATAKFVDITHFMYGIILYTIGGIGWFLIIKYVKLSSVGIIYGVSTAILLAVVGVVFFKEKLNTIEIIAAIVGLASILVLLRFSE